MNTSTVPSKGWLATFALLAVLIGIAGAGYVAAHAAVRLPTKPVVIGQGVSVFPPDDWEFVGRRPGDASDVWLSRGSANLEVLVKQATDVRAVLTSLKDDWAASGLVTVSDISENTELRPGQTGLRVTYTGTFDRAEGVVEGAVTAYGGTGVVAIFEGWAGIGHYSTASGDVDAMIRGATLP